MKIIRNKATQEFHSAVPDEAIDPSQQGAIPHTRWIVPEELEIIDMPEDTVEGFSEKLAKATGGRNIGRFKVEDPGKLKTNPGIEATPAQLAEDEFEAEIHGLVIRGEKLHHPKSSGGKA